ncbi:hypothetical protein K501DRAFT_269491 [Backusella circina FSU 941]|nr:hypothetical protein K501DRAFT_269491 [Backusella circina FSU 941]
MDNFPAEVLNRIFFHLHLVQKTQCMLVCKQWAHAIRSFNLLHSISISTSTKRSSVGSRRICSMLSRIKKQPDLGSQTHHLLLDECIDKGFDSSVLPKLFPRLHVLCLRFRRINQHGLDELLLIKPQLGRYRPWHNTLECIVEDQRCYLVPIMLKSGIFNKLTSISVSGTYDYINFSHRDIIKKLKNAPALKTLKLERFPFQLFDFEALHVAAPLLTSLTLIGIFIDTLTIRGEIKPVTHLEKLVIDLEGLQQDPQIGLVEYISEKYTNLIHFSIDFVAEKLDPWEEPEFDDDVFYETLIRPLVFKLGTQLKTFHLVTSQTTLNLFDDLDKKGYQLQDLRFNSRASCVSSELFFGSNQIHTLTTLSLEWMQFQQISMLSALKSLKTLKLSVEDHLDINHDTPKYKGVAFNQILNNCPDRLENLYLYKAHMTMNRPSKELSFIKKLKLVECRLDDKAMAFIPTHCKQLSAFILHHCTFPEVTLDFTLHDLTHFEMIETHKFWFRLTTKYKTLLFTLSVEPPNNAHHIKECFEPNTILVESICKPMFPDLGGSIPNFHIHCHSLKTLYINGRIAF